MHSRNTTEDIPEPFKRYAHVALHEPQHTPTHSLEDTTLCPPPHKTATREDRLFVLLVMLFFLNGA